MLSDFLGSGPIIQLCFSTVDLPKSQDTKAQFTAATAIHQLDRSLFPVVARSPRVKSAV